jgi:hypothetical protein
VAELETQLRYEWWNNHGCGDYRYGDDGEMQCSGCMADFKRDDFAELAEHVKKTRWDALCRAGKKIEAKQSKLAAAEELARAAEKAVPKMWAGSLGQVCSGCGANSFEFAPHTSECPAERLRAALSTFRETK